ncbi:hypothetical protein C2G38_2031283 [Gigaspora rosea]|uniref:Uncharacterized protein n=1 Tax=Gigaspora rosea TaxID=44941 RepID=A0A397VTS8_9GLOM|nr:hypothetical protein C2G38_2031283 [Gigaspora rosea]
MEQKDKRLKVFFKELYLSSNPSSKSEDSKIRIKRQLLFACYFICGIHNKFVNNIKSNIALYLDSVSASDSSINTLSDLGVTTTTHTVAQHKTSISEEHANAVNSTLAQYMENAMVLNIDDYHSIHTKRVPNTTTTSDAAHLVTILINPITTQPAISNIDIHNPLLVDAKLIKRNIATKFMTLYSFSHNQRWGFRVVDSNKKLEELTIHNYDTRLKEKQSTRSIKNTVLIDLQENDLHTIDAYVKAINTVASVLSVQQYLERVEIFHSFLRRGTQKNTEAQQIIKYRHYINQLRLDNSTSTWATQEYSARDIAALIKKSMLKKLNNGKKKKRKKVPTQESEKNTCDDDYEVVPMRYKALILEEALQKFQSQ